MANTDPNVETRFRSGQSGNPNGRPLKGYSITEWFKEMLNSDPDVRERLGRSILNKALDGDIAAIKLIWNHLDGIPRQATDISSDRELPIPILPLPDEVLKSLEK